MPLRTRFLLYCIASFIFAPRVVAQERTFAEIGEIERLDPAFDELISPDAHLEKLAEGFGWAEGPVWNHKERCLLFSDVPNNLVNKWDERKGLSLFLRPSGYTGKKPVEHPQGSNGLLYDAHGRLVLCQHGDRRIARLEGANKFVTLAAKYQGKRLNSPNDAAYRSNGDLYFTDPPYGLAGGEDDPERELPFCGVYRLDKQGKLTLLAADMTRPNGIAFSPDEKLLYVAQSDPEEPIIRVFEVKDDGTLAHGRVFFDASQLAKDENKGSPDGLKVDHRGNLFATGPGGVLVISPRGKHLGTLRTGVATANCAWGGNGSTLYITAHNYLMRIKTKTAAR